MLRSKVLRAAAGALVLAATTLTALPAASAGVLFENEIVVSWDEGPTTAVPGDDTTFTLVVTNEGPDLASTVVTLDFGVGTIGTWSCSGTAGTNCGAGGSGPFTPTPLFNTGAGTATYTIQVLIPSDATGTITASAIADPAGVDDDLTNNSDSDTDTLTPQADMAVTKTDGVTSVKPGQQVTYTMVVTNNGPSDSPGGIFTDNFPATLQDVTWTCTGGGGGLCSTGSTGNISDQFIFLPAGGTATYTATATVDPELDALDVVANTATIAGDGAGDGDGGNNSATDLDIVADLVSDLVALKTAPATAVVGGTISYTIGVRNDGPDEAREVELTDTLPADTTFVSMTQTAGPAATLTTPAVGNGGTVEAAWDTLADEAEATFTVVVQLGAGAEVGDAIVNTAAVESLDEPPLEEAVASGEVTAAATVDPAEGNNAVTVTTLVIAQATTTTATTTTIATTTTATVGAGGLARTGGDPGGPTGLALMVLGGGLAVVGIGELRRQRALGRL